MREKITDIQVSVDWAPHRHLILNGGPSIVVHASVIEKFGLRVGLEIESSVIEKLVAADEVTRAKQRALDLLREAKEHAAAKKTERVPEVYTKSEIRRQLAHHGFSTDTVATALAELIQSGHIRDRKYAENWVVRRQKSNPRGKTLLKHELVKKGIDKETVEQVVAAIDTEEETKIALRIARKRARQYRRLPNHVAKRRLHGFLARRGFGTDIVRQVLDQVF